MVTDAMFLTGIGVKLYASNRQTVLYSMLSVKILDFQNPIIVLKIVMSSFIQKWIIQLGHQAEWKLCVRKIGPKVFVCKYFGYAGTYCGQPIHYKPGKSHILSSWELLLKGKFWIERTIYFRHYKMGLNQSTLVLQNYSENSRWMCS